jgi:Fe-S-cluster containining protein
MGAMPSNDSTPRENELPAGRFSDWLRAMRAALKGNSAMDVACGACVGCCTSSYFIKIRAHETRALAAIEPRHLHAGPGAGDQLLMGHAANGHCHMFAGGGCSIYPDRPETCRTYDCRVFTAAGIPAGEGKTMINERVAAWRFEYRDDADREAHRAVQAAAAFLRQHVVRFPNGHVPSRPSEIAVLAVKTYPVFLGETMPDRETAAAIVSAGIQFDA